MRKSHKELLLKERNHAEILAGSSVLPLGEKLSLGCCPA
jgi:hypothetical protein